jgi:HD-GYP domain-containing protein (c-di-GMP phosphodiesterase class II)
VTEDLAHIERSTPRRIRTLIEECATRGLACWWVPSGAEPVVAASLNVFDRVDPTLRECTIGSPRDLKDPVRIDFRREGRVMGVLAVVPGDDVRCHALDRDSLRTMLSLALNDPDAECVVHEFTEHLAQAFENIQLLYRVGQAMSKPDDPSGFARFLVDEILDSTPFRWAALVFDDNPTLVESVRSQCVVSTLIDGARAIISNEAVRIARKLRESGGGIFKDANHVIESQGTAHLVISAGEPVGMLICGGKQGKEADISSYDTQLLDASASHLGSVLETARLYQAQASMFLGTISSLIRALDAKDHYTRGHSDRVAALARQLARAAGIDDKTADRYHIAGLLHDVGKIGVPEAVLCKPGRLTDEEFAFIMRHPEIGYKILDGVPGMEDLLPGVMYHHERYDGMGYPHGIAGEEIPIIARVLCLADTFDAMSSNRAYRSAMTREVVLAEINRCAGTQFDPILAPLFVKLDFEEYDRMVARHVRQAAIDAQGRKAA